LFPLFATGINSTSSTGGKFTAGAVDNGRKITLVLFSGAWGKMIHEKTRAKYLVTLSL
jgi:hypothetical protein